MPRLDPEGRPLIATAPAGFRNRFEERRSPARTEVSFIQSRNRFIRGLVASVGITIVLVLPTILSAATTAMGETSVFSGDDGGNGNLLIAQDATLFEVATLQSVSFYVTQASGSLRLGVYSATGPGGGPGSLVAQTDSFVPTVGWNTRPVTTPVLLQSGTYWIAYTPSSNDLRFATNFSIGSFVAANRTFGGMPATFPAVTIAGTTHWSLYATLDTASDTAPPSTPTGLSATAVSSTQINLSWTASSDNVGVAGYRVFRNGTQVATTTPAGTVYSDSGLSANTLYGYTVTAYDAAGNISGSSGTAFATTLLPPPPPLPDTQAPSVPTGLHATNVTSSSATLSWVASSDNVGVAGYAISRDGVQVATTVTLTYTNPGLAPLTSYIYTVAAYDAAGNISAPSSGVQVATAGGAQVITMGETSISAGVDSGNANLLIVQAATLSEAGSIQSLSFYVVNAAGTLRLGVYDATATGGNPGNRVAQTNVFTPGPGWNTVPVIAPAQLPAGNYWLAYFASDNGLSFATNFSAGSYRAAPLTFGPMPATFPASSWQGATHWSLYATLNGASPGPDNIPPTIAISSPTSGALVSDIVNITANAADNIGVVGVQFFIDGVQVGPEDSTAPYGYAWDTRSAGNGLHTVRARARDAANLTATTAPVTVNVSNANFFQNEILVTGLNLPTALKFLPDGRMLVTELPGAIKVLPPPYTTPNPTLFLDLNLNITGYEALQQGIFDIALDPNFTANRFYYVFYTNDSPRRDRLSRFTANVTLTGTIPGSELILYEDPQVPNVEHHGGAVAFGNDGKIYFTTGEHFSANLAQDLTSPRGKIHRINSNGTAPADNPFYDGTGPNWDSVWAVGLRNPYRANYDPPSGRLYIGDVGGNEYLTAHEEVNVGARGANYGWPQCEVGACGNPGFTPAVYAYAHSGRDAAVTGGFVYRGTQFPAEYQGKYFFADYAQNWIKYLAFDTQGNANGVFNFEPADGSADGPYGDIVYLTEGPEGALYYIDLGYSDVGGTFGISKIRRIRYLQSNQQPTAIAAASPSSGPVPLTVNFSSAGSIDPEGAPLNYAWDFGDGATSSQANPTHVYAVSGQHTARLTVSDGVSETLAPPLFINVGHEPVGVIASPLNNALFIGGQSITYSGNATDAEDGALPSSAYTWDIDFLHAGHVHPATHVVGVTSGTFNIPTSGHDFSGDTRYRITLTVADSDGLTDTQSVVIYPRKVNLTLQSQVAGSGQLSLDIILDGIPRATPFVYDTLINFQHTIEALDQGAYSFASWSDGGAQEHTVTVPATNTTYVAAFEAGTTNTPITMGETTVFGGVDSGNGNILVAQSASLSEPASIQSLSFYVVSPAGQLRLGIYDATGPGGNPGRLVAQTNVFTPGAGWNNVPVIAQAQLPAGNYWLAYFASDSGLSFSTNFSAGAYRAAPLTFGPMPAAFPSSYWQGVTHWSLYGTLAP